MNRNSWHPTGVNRACIDIYGIRHLVIVHTSTFLAADLLLPVKPALAWVVWEFTRTVSYGMALKRDGALCKTGIDMGCLGIHEDRFLWDGVEAR